LLNFLMIVCNVVLPIRSHVSWILPTFGTCLFLLVGYFGFFSEHVDPSSSTWRTNEKFRCHAEHGIQMNLLPLATYCCIMGGMSLWAGFRNEAYARKEWLAQQQVEKQIDISEKQRQGFSDVLQRMSDCLLLLGPDLEIMEPCPNLAAMLMLGGQQLQGSRFTDYLASTDDQDSFVLAMGTDILGAVPSGILPLHLKDRFHRDIQVHAYYAFFYAKDNSRYHIVGIVEAQEKGFLEPLAPLAFGDRAGMEMKDSPIAGSISSGSGTSFSRYSELLETEIQWGLNLSQTDQPVAVAVVDPFSPCLDIIRCNAEFANLGGAFSGGLPLQKWLGRSSNGQFLKLTHEIQKVFQNAAYQEESVSIAFGSLKLYPPGIEGQLYLVAQCLIACAVKIPETTDDEATEDFEKIEAVKVALVFSGIKWKRLKKLSGGGLTSRPIGRRSEVLFL